MMEQLPDYEAGMAIGEVIVAICLGAVPLGIVLTDQLAWARWSLLAAFPHGSPASAALTTQSSTARRHPRRRPLS